ncbi:unnamed protein product [Gongylonema pulchrum]|uniref:CDCA2 n=1 Tax=Gongylonema pulchrum TaxID=637853 RepID=A0A183ED77_9BILA|nr:unnamed protein product [Gongylonema pulchrum]
MEPAAGEHQSRSRVRTPRASSPLHPSNFEDRLASLETEEEFRASLEKCPKGGDSLERNPPPKEVEEITAKPPEQKLPPRTPGIVWHLSRLKKSSEHR